jgi:hypothetical protein
MLLAQLLALDVPPAPTPIRLEIGRFEGCKSCRSPAPHVGCDFVSDVMATRRTVTGARDGPQPSRQVVLRDGEARVVLALLDVRGVDRLWTLTGRGIPVRVDASLEWEPRRISADPAVRSLRLPAGGTDVVVHDSRTATPRDLENALDPAAGVAAVVIVDEHRVDVLTPATARDRATGADRIESPPVRQRLTRVIFDLASACLDAGIDLRAVYCGPVIWNLLANEPPRANRPPPATTNQPCCAADTPSCATKTWPKTRSA